MKPFKSLLFLIVVFAILVLISWQIPKGGIPIYKNYKIKFPALSGFFANNNIKYADISY